MSLLCVALDDPDRASGIVDRTAASADIFKVGLTLFAARGPAVVTEVLSRRPVFLDLKLHDIPAQVEGTVDAVAGLGVSYVTVHASGGRAMVRAAARAAASRTTILAVTVLTSLDEDDLRSLGIEASPGAQVTRLADLALEAGAGGLVCSPREVAALRDRYGRVDEGGPVIVVPGIRPAGSARDDQRRTLTPREAARAGADVVVVGRPVTGATDPAAAAALVKEDLG